MNQAPLAAKVILILAVIVAVLIMIVAVLAGLNPDDELGIRERVITDNQKERAVN